MRTRLFVDCSRGTYGVCETVTLGLMMRVKAFWDCPIRYLLECPAFTGEERLGS